jgi:hypothetical protein
MKLEDNIDEAASPLTAIARSSDRAWLKRCRDHNVSTGKEEVVDAVRRRFWDLALDDALRLRSDAGSVEERGVACNGAGLGPEAWHPTIKALYEASSNRRTTCYAPR